LIEAIDAAVPGQDLMLKWPNDLLMGQAKLAGILLERQEERVVAGFGVNLAAAPEVGERRTAHLDGRILPEAFAPLLAASFARVIDSWRSAEPARFADAWLARAHSPGSPLSVHGESGGRLTGTFAGIELDGALRLAMPGGGIEIVRSGDVTLG